MSALKILFLKTIFKKEGINFLGEDMSVCREDAKEVLVFHDSKENIRFGISEDGIEFSNELYTIVYNEPKQIETVIKNIKTRQKQREILSRKLEPYLKFSDKEMKKYLVEHIDDLEV